MTTERLYYCPACGAYVIPLVCGDYGTCPQCAAETALPWQEDDVSANAADDADAADALTTISVLDHGFVRLVGWLGNDEAIARAARVSFGQSTKTPEQDRRLIARLMKDRHTSPFEHVVFTLHVKAPLFVARQWMRHRTWSYSELSQRYAQAAPEFYLPALSELRSQSETNKQASGEALPEDMATALRFGMASSYENAHRDYSLLLRYGVSREQARLVLPVSVYTQFYGTVDLHNLFHFLRLRLAADAQYEIRVYAEAIARLIEPIVPAAYAAFEESLS